MVTTPQHLLNEASTILKSINFKQRKTELRRTKQPAIIEALSFFLWRYNKTKYDKNACPNPAYIYPGKAVLHEEYQQPLCDLPDLSDSDRHFYSLITFHYSSKLTIHHPLIFNQFNPLNRKVVSWIG